MPYIEKDSKAHGTQQGREEGHEVLARKALEPVEEEADAALHPGLKRRKTRDSASRWGSVAGFFCGASASLAATVGPRA